jgi:branched-chain amino acid transport system ATP-binding protein
LGDANKPNKAIEERKIMPMLNVSGIDVFYGLYQAVSDFSFSVDKGEIVVLLGPNGAGKTTTLRAISGIQKVKSGTIEFEGTHLNELPANLVIEKGIAHVPQGRGIFPQLSVLENLKMGAYTKSARGMTSDSLENVFSLFPILKERKSQSGSTLSGGEQQMLAIGRGLMSRPKLLLLDEPSEGLAPRVTEELFEIVEKLNENGVTILLVEQNIHQALRLASRAYVAEAGKIVLSGKSDEIARDEHVRKAYLGL